MEPTTPTRQDRTRMLLELLGILGVQFFLRKVLSLLGVPLADAELFQASDGSLRSPIAAVVIEPVPSKDGKFQALRMTFRGETKTGKRAD